MMAAYRYQEVYQFLLQGVQSGRFQGLLGVHSIFHKLMVYIGYDFGVLSTMLV